MCDSEKTPIHPLYMTNDKLELHVLENLFNVTAGREQYGGPCHLSFLFICGVVRVCYS